jgi:hypothetical protein
MEPIARIPHFLPAKAKVIGVRINAFHWILVEAEGIQETCGYAFTNRQLPRPTSDSAPPYTPPYAPPLR